MAPYRGRNWLLKHFKTAKIMNRKLREVRIYKTISMIVDSENYWDIRKIRAVEISYEAKLNPSPLVQRGN